MRVKLIWSSNSKLSENGKNYDNSSDCRLGAKKCYYFHQKKNPLQAFREINPNNEIQGSSKIWSCHATHGSFHTHVQTIPMRLIFF